jgi:hypothetical protein
MKFLTQGFTRGFFRNADQRPAELKLAKFTGTLREDLMQRRVRPSIVIPARGAVSINLKTEMDDYDPLFNGAR